MCRDGNIGLTVVFWASLDRAMWWLICGSRFFFLIIFTTTPFYLHLPNFSFLTTTPFNTKRVTERVFTYPNTGPRWTTLHLDNTHVA